MNITARLLCRLCQRERELAQLANQAQAFTAIPHAKWPGTVLADLEVVAGRLVDRAAAWSRVTQHAIDQVNLATLAEVDWHLHQPVSMPRMAQQVAA